MIRARAAAARRRPLPAHGETIQAGTEARPTGIAALEFAILKAGSAISTDFGGGMMLNLGMVFYKTT